jgi:hypothetical protein
MIAAVCAFGQDLKFSTYSLQADIAAIDAPTASLAATLDNANRTHVAWMKAVGTSTALMYTVYDNQTATTLEIPIQAATARELKAAPSIILDANQRPHVTYFVKRDRDGGLVSGNYAVMYAGDSDGDGVFEVSQVSTNPTSPTSSVASTFDAYVNGRPSIALDAGQILIAYYGASNSATSYSYNINFARKTGSGWTRTQEMKAANTSPSIDVTLPRAMTFSSHMVWIDYGYNPHFSLKNGTNWNDVTIPNYGSTALAGSRHAQIEVDNAGTIHFIWFNQTKVRFCKTTLSGSSYTAVEEDAQVPNYSSNFYPATIDPLTSRPYYAYNTSTKGYRLIAKNGSGQRLDTVISPLGAVYGKRSLNVRNGFISFVTASESNHRIYITTNATTSAVDRGPSAMPVRLFLSPCYPNPFNPTTTTQFSLDMSGRATLRVFDLLGREVKTLFNDVVEAGVERQVVFDATGLVSGTYVLRLESAGRATAQKVILQK